MPPQSRSQRRRQQRPRPRPTREATGADASVLDTALPNSVELPVAPVESERASPPPATGAARPARAGRRTNAQRALEPVDYTPDYVAARRDLTRIAIISGLLMAVMIGLYFAGIF